jgi:hypothetical protein
VADSTFQFDPERVAYYEAEGWRAYYDHQWVKVFWLIISMSQEQFRIPFPMSVLASYYITRASIAWVPKQHDAALVLRFHKKFYDLARRYSGLKFDPERAALLEEQYWDIHRRASSHPDKDAFTKTLVDLHSELFGISPEQARESAELRVTAANIVDTITAKTSADPEADWKKLEDYLRQCYRSVQRALKQPAVASP